MLLLSLDAAGVEEEEEEGDEEEVEGVVVLVGIGAAVVTPAPPPFALYQLDEVVELVDLMVPTGTEYGPEPLDLDDCTDLADLVVPVLRWPTGTLYSYSSSLFMYSST